MTLISSASTPLLMRIGQKNYNWTHLALDLCDPSKIFDTKIIRAKQVTTWKEFEKMIKIDQDVI